MPKARARSVMVGTAGAIALLVALAAGIAQAQTAAPAATADLATRVADLEAYVTNGTPKALISSGPGHNAWMMTSSALVLFMTLPGLALFYGGLVRRKNILSVMAQCLGCAGLVAVLWWAAGAYLKRVGYTDAIADEKLDPLPGLVPEPAVA